MTGLALSLALVAIAFVARDVALRYMAWRLRDTEARESLVKELGATADRVNRLKADLTSKVADIGSRLERIETKENAKALSQKRG